MNNQSKIQQIWRLYGVMSLKILFVIGILGALAKILAKKLQWNDLQQSWQIAQNPEQWKWLIGIFGFVILNWSLEALKWYILGNKIKKISFFDSFKGVLAGVSLSSFAPMLLGDYLGRISFLTKNRKKEATTLLLYGHFVQSVALLWFGAVSYYFLSSFEISFFQPTFAKIFLVAALLSLALLIFSKQLVGLLFIHPIFSHFKIKQVSDFLNKIQFKAPFQVITTIRFQENIFLLFVAFVRHFVFALQFYFSLKFVGITLPFSIAFSLINIVFIFKTIGAFAGFWGDIATRQLSAVYLFGLFSVSISATLSATFLVWLANLFLPICIGLIFVVQMPLKRLFPNNY